MNPATPFSSRDRWRALLAVAARWSLGVLFIYMGWKKAMDPVDFLKLVRQYDLVQTPMVLNLIAATLPWFEVFCGALLLSGVAVRGAAGMSLVMLVPFTAIVLQRALALHAASTIPFCAIRFDCGCGAGEVAICFKLAENTLLMVLSALLLFWRQPRGCVKYSLFERDER